jgi:hypothetical protein
MSSISVFIFQTNICYVHIYLNYLVSLHSKSILNVYIAKLSLLIVYLLLHVITFLLFLCFLSLCIVGIGPLLKHFAVRLHLFIKYVTNTI